MKCILDINSEVYDHYYQDVFCQYFKRKMKAWADYREFSLFLLKKHTAHAN